MSSLSLAVDIADAAKEARLRDPVDVAQTAAELSEAHPDAPHSSEDVAEALRAVLCEETGARE